MKAEKQLVKVVATSLELTNQGQTTTNKVGRGIRPLKCPLLEFMASFFKDREILAYNLHPRGINGITVSWASSPIPFMESSKMSFLTFEFFQFPLSDLSFYARDLTADEQIRDYQLLKRILK